MQLLLNWGISAVVLLVASYLLPGIHVESFIAALATALVLGIINAVLKPILLILTLPINILTLGLFTLVINALLIMLTTVFVPGFKVDSFWWALGLALLLSVVNTLIHSSSKK
ncbi:MAG: phage holin family protein [Candidatus Daviesbacteria bacterium]